jgi:hypothetical protein
MRTSISILLAAVLLITGCKENKTEKSTTTEGITENSSSGSNTQNNVLCKINGQPWSYTEASGIVLSNKKKGIRKLMLTFTNYLNPGKEHIGLDFNWETKELIEASVQIKLPSTDGKRIHAIYQFNDRVKKKPNSAISGQVTLNDDGASGSATLQHIPLQYEAHLLQNKEFTEITVTDLSFKNIFFTDPKKEMEEILNKTK